MSKNRKSIMLYISIVFLITYIWEIGVFASGISYGSVRYQAWMVGIMWFPAVAVWLTKLLTKEKIRFGLQSEIGFVVKDHRKNGRYYVLAVLAPVVIYMVGANAIVYVFYSENFDFTGISAKSVINAVVMALGVGIIYSLIQGLGEEIGWRGFLMPRLRKQVPMPAMLVISGIIWGLWHAPLLWNGHLFGTDYKWAPWGGILMMCVFCIFYGAWCYYLYVRSGSIFVCALAHGLHNICYSSFILIGVKEELLEDMMNQFGVVCLTLLPAMFLGAWAFWRLCKDGE